MMAILSNFVVPDNLVARTMDRSSAERNETEDVLRRERRYSTFEKTAHTEFEEPIEGSVSRIVGFNVLIEIPGSEN